MSLVHERAREAAVWRTLNVDTGHSCPTRRYDPSDSDIHIVEDGFVRERQEQLFERIPLREHPTLSKASKSKEARKILEWPGPLEKKQNCCIELGCQG